MALLRVRRAVRERSASPRRSGACPALSRCACCASAGPVATRAVRPWFLAGNPGSRRFRHWVAGPSSSSGRPSQGTCTSSTRRHGQWERSLSRPRGGRRDRCRARGRGVRDAPRPQAWAVRHGRGGEDIEACAPSWSGAPDPGGVRLRQLRGAALRVRYPDRVERMVPDAPVDAAGSTPSSRLDSFAAASALLRAVPEALSVHVGPCGRQARLVAELAPPLEDTGGRRR